MGSFPMDYLKKRCKRLLRMKHKRFCCLFLGVLLLAGAFHFTTEASSINELKEEQKKAQEEAEKLKKEKDQLKESMAGVNSEIYNISETISSLMDEIAATEASITETEKNLEATQKLADEQYASMKSRIQYIYENGNSSFFQLLIEAEDFASFLNRVEYTAELNRYDREMLNSYQENIRQIAAYKEELDTKHSELIAQKEQLQNDKTTLTAKASSLQNEISSNEDDIEQKQNEIENYAEKIAAMEEYERKLREEQAKQQLDMDKIKDQEAEIAGNNTPVTPAEGEAYLLAAIIQCEAGPSHYDGQLAVGSVIMNRVRSSAFPNTITEVVYQPNQFSPAASGRLALVMQTGVSASAQQAANEVLSGTTTVNCLYFRSDNGTINGISIGGNVFY